jgi:hypothetical protein
MIKIHNTVIINPAKPNIIKTKFYSGRSLAIAYNLVQFNIFIIIIIIIIIIIMKGMSKIK